MINTSCDDICLVAEVQLSPVDDLTIAFSNGVVLEQFMPSSQKREEWRLIDHLRDEHIVYHDEEGNIALG